MMPEMAIRRGAGGCTSQLLESMRRLRPSLQNRNTEMGFSIAKHPENDWGGDEA